MWSRTAGWVGGVGMLLTKTSGRSSSPPVGALEVLACVQSEVQR